MKKKEIAKKMKLDVIKQRGRFGTVHYITSDKPKGSYQNEGMSNYVFDSERDALKAFKKRQKK